MVTSYRHAVIACAGAACLLAACTVNVRESAPDRSVTRHVARHYTFGGSARVLSVTGSGDDVRVTGGGAAIVATVHLDYRGRPPTVVHRRSGGTVHLAADCRSRHHCAGGWDVRVPRDMAVRAVDPVGAIRLEALAGGVLARCGVGSIHGTRLAGQRIRLRCATGDIVAALSAPSHYVSATSDTGSVTLTLPAARYELHTTTAVGAEHVTTPDTPGSGHVVVARTDVGTVTVDAA